jgi:hypothetical protein
VRIVFLVLELSCRVSQIQLLGPRKPQALPCPLHKITPRKRTMVIEKPMKVTTITASAFPASPESPARPKSRQLPEN